MSEDSGSVSESIASLIRESERVGLRSDNVTISDKAAKQLARELSYLQFRPIVSSSEIYRDLKAGRCRFMDVALTVASR